MSSRWRSMRLSPLKHKSPDFEEVLEVDQWQARPDSVGAESAKVLTVDHHGRTPASGGHSAHAHHDHALRKIHRLQLREIQVPELQLEVRADAVVERITAQPLEALAAHVKRRMRNHRGKTEHPGPPPLRRTVPHGRCGTQRLHRCPIFNKSYVGIKRVNSAFIRNIAKKTYFAMFRRNAFQIEPQCAQAYRTWPGHRPRSGCRQCRLSPS